MAPRPAPIKQADLTRYVNAVRKAGVPVGRVVIKGGEVTIYAQGENGDDTGPNPCDELLR
jgi:hypothetical protein